MRGQRGEPTEGTVLQHHCLSLVTKGGGEDAEKGCFLVKTKRIKIHPVGRMSARLWQSDTVTEDSCHRGMSLLTSSGWALSFRNFLRLRLEDFFEGEGGLRSLAGSPALQQICHKPRIGRARCSAGEDHLYLKRFVHHLYHYSQSTNNPTCWVCCVPSRAELHIYSFDLFCLRLRAMFQRSF